MLMELLSLGLLELLRVLLLELLPAGVAVEAAARAIACAVARMRSCCRFVLSCLLVLVVTEGCLGEFGARI